MARKFLYIVAALITLVIALGVTYRLFGEDLIKRAMVPSAVFKAPLPQKRDAYADAKMWVARPDIAGNPALWLPQAFAPQILRSAQRQRASPDLETGGR